MQGRKYVIYDVFTGQRLSGNPLAVVLDAEGLDTGAMQRIAGEFNLSETSFVTAPQDASHRARVRIFTPVYEMPFAGHPTVGTAIALYEAQKGEGAAAIFVFEENIGPVRCAVTGGKAATFAEFDLPQVPEKLALSADAAAIGAAVGLAPHEIGFENHRVGLWSAGVPYIAIPVSGLDAARRARLDNRAWRELSPQRGDGKTASAYIYCRETVSRDNSFHARMFVPGTPSYEDPATGSAAAAFAGVIMQFDAPPEGPSRFWIEQGVEMGRPSRIRLEIDVENSAMAAARIGGNAVKVAEGVLYA
jgi:trans-2,3-dihydro-3-hydroxyanthranilate isomerase